MGNITDLSNVLGIVTDLNTKVDNLQKENKKLTAKLDSVEAELKDLKSKLQVGDRNIANVAIPPQPLNNDETQNMQEPEQSNNAEEPNQADQNLIIHADSSASSGPDSDAEDTPAQILGKIKKYYKKAKNSNSRPQKRESTIKPAPKMIDLFIGEVDTKYGCKDIQDDIYGYTKVKVDITGIQEKSSRGNRKSFKVTVPEEIQQQVMTKIWPDSIKVEPYGLPKPKVTAAPHRQPIKPKGNNRQTSYNKHNTFRGPARDTRRHTTGQHHHFPGHYEWSKPNVPSYMSQQWTPYQPTAWHYEPTYNY